MREFSILVDQPGIGGKKISAQGYMVKFTPGHYDFTLAATSTRLMENEYFLMMHLQKFERHYIIVRTKVDADVISNIGNMRKVGDDKVKFLTFTQFNESKTNFCRRKLKL